MAGPHPTPASPESLTIVRGMHEYGPVGLAAYGFATLKSSQTTSALGRVEFVNWVAPHNSDRRGMAGGQPEAFKHVRVERDLDLIVSARPAVAVVLSALLAMAGLDVARDVAVAAAQ